MPQQSDKAKLNFGGLNAPSIRPQSQAIDTFSRPGGTEFGGPPPESSLGSLAQAISKFGQGFNKNAKGLIEDEGKRSIAEGELLRLENNKVKFKEAVKAGIIPEGANPHLIAGYKRAELRGLATQFNESFALDYEQSGLKGDTSTGKYQDFYDTKLKAFMEENGVSEYDSLDVQSGFFPGVKQGQQINSAKHQANVIKENERRANNAWSHEAGGIIDEAYAYDSTVVDLGQDGLTEELDLEAPGVRSKYLGGELQKSLQGHIDNGLNPKTANETLASQIIAQAELTHDAELLDVLDHINTGNGPLSNIAKIKAKVLDARRKIPLMKYQLAQAENNFHNIEDKNWLLKESLKTVEDTKKQRKIRDEKYTEKEKLEDLYSELTGKILQNPNWANENPKEFRKSLSEINTLDPDAVDKVRKFETAILDSRNAMARRYKTTKQLHDEFATARFDAINNPEKLDAIALKTKLLDGTFTKEEYKEITKEWEKSRKNIHEFFNSEVYKDLVGDIEKTIIKGGTQLGDHTASSVIASSGATADLRLGMIDFIQNEKAKLKDGEIVDRITIEEKARAMMHMIMNRPSIRHFLEDDEKFYKGKEVEDTSQFTSIVDGHTPDQLEIRQKAQDIKDAQAEVEQKKIDDALAKQKVLDDKEKDLEEQRQLDIKNKAKEITKKETDKDETLEKLTEKNTEAEAKQKVLDDKQKALDKRNKLAKKFVEKAKKLQEKSDAIQKRIEQKATLKKQKGELSVKKQKVEDARQAKQIKLYKKEVFNMVKENFDVELTDDEISLDPNKNVLTALNKMPEEQFTSKFNINERQLQLIKEVVQYRDVETLKQVKDKFMKRRQVRVNNVDLTDNVWERVLKIATKKGN